VTTQPQTATVPERLAALDLRSGQIALWWLGQATFLLRSREATVLVDPFLSPHPDRRVPPPFAPRDAEGVDVVLITHDHLDHLDDDALPGIAEASPACWFVVPEPVAFRLTDLGIAGERVVPAQPGRPLGLGGVRIDPVPASHGVEPADAYSFGRELSGGLVRYLGYVLDLDGTRVYHAGDTIPYDGIEAGIAAFEPELALLPINGRSAEREAQGIVGNLDEEEAVELAAAIGAAVLVPIHWDLFAANPGDPGAAVRLAATHHPALSVLVLSRERPFVYTKAEA
jgi:L-ascorbate 6-phosphate lactonase